MRVVFMGTPEFSVPVLEALVAAGHEIAAVYCQPPRPAGRGKKERPTPVHARAVDLGLEVRHPVSLKGAEEQADFAALQADVAVVVAYGLLLPFALVTLVLGMVGVLAARSLRPRRLGSLFKALAVRLDPGGKTQIGQGVLMGTIDLASRGQAGNPSQGGG
mgnify:CR=1 FL=1